MTNHLARRVVATAAARGKTIATAESCTGGLIAATLTDVAGSSAAFGFGFVSYANVAKTTMLGVDENLIDSFGAVSEPVARAMANGALSRANSDVAIAVTGIAGPEGGSPEKPVGTVWFGIARRGGKTTTIMRSFTGDRAAIRYQSVDVALALLLEALDQP